MPFIVSIRPARWTGATAQSLPLEVSMLVRGARPTFMRYVSILVTTLALLLAVGAAETGAAENSDSRAATAGSTKLTSGWALRSATGLADTGDVISRVGYGTSGWHPVTLPTTVLAGLVQNRVYQNIYFGQNLKNVPDLTTQKWWFRGEFKATAASPGQAYWLRFKGISYRAQIWLNGTLLDANAVGTLAQHEYNVGNLIRPGEANALAILVTPPAHACKDLSICTVDWNPEAPDMNAGLWGDTILETTGPVALRDPYVKTVLPLPATDSADLTVYADAVNATQAPVTAKVNGTISKAGHPSLTFSRTVTLGPGERREIAFKPIHVAKPALWWPHQYGKPELYHLKLRADVDKKTSDVKEIDFGVRQFTDYRKSVNDTSWAAYKVNGKNVLFRGGGYVWDLLQRWDTKTNATHVQYVKDMGLNTIRLEGTLGNEELYDLADRNGIMLMPGFVCCSAWQSDDEWTAEQTEVAMASLDSQMRALRHHASPFMWNYGSDEPPEPAHLAAYKNIAAKLHWQNPTVDNVATWSNPDAGMKMDGPYVWEPPVLWWDTTRAGSAFGTTGEEGTQAPPPLESVQKFLAPSDQWPLSDAWNFHAGRPSTVFDTTAPYDKAIDNRYGKATGAADYARKSELQNYENTRAFFEAWSSHKYSKSFGTIFWMLNNSWPSVQWNLYDYFFKPGGGYFGTKKASEPVHIAYDYNTGKVYIVNSTLKSRTDLKATATFYTVPDLKQEHGTTRSVSAPANASSEIMKLPAVSGLSSTYFVRLQLKDSSGAVVSNNLYWNSTRPDELGTKSDWYYTEVKTYADFSGLNSLPSNPNLTASATRAGTNGHETATVKLTNTSPKNITFFVRPEVTAGADGTEVLPITYSDNYVTLWPGESTTINAAYATRDLGGKQPHLRIRGYNVPSTSIPIP
ncbi:glycoside hydrolase family 2 protein [Spirillospora sp. NPDC048911]|uniref:glycoside hydrolase family 2 protein n=1 Tax=Spirillospora sp. NPDC048911 TaxID=3364527 RepID=UPI0037248803